jgi:hypothetical protein
MKLIPWITKNISLFAINYTYSVDEKYNLSWLSWESDLFLQNIFCQLKDHQIDYEFSKN